MKTKMADDGQPWTNSKKNLWKKIIPGTIVKFILLLICLCFSAQTPYAGTIGSLNLTIGESSRMNLTSSIGQSANIQTEPGTVIRVALQGASNMLPFGTLILPDGTQEEWPASSTAQNGYNNAEKVFAYSGQYIFTTHEKNNLSGSIQILLEGKGHQDITDIDDSQDHLYQQGIEEGKRICFENPELCDITVSANGYSESDLEAARNEGYQAGVASCETISSDEKYAATYNFFTNTLNVPNLDLGESSSFWITLELTGGDPLTFVMKEFGTNSD